jgi:hypothetical protein
VESNAASRRPAPKEQQNGPSPSLLDAGPILSWEQWDAAAGVVSLGGDAVDDCDHLYDDDGR